MSEYFNRIKVCLYQSEQWQRKEWQVGSYTPTLKGLAATCHSFWFIYASNSCFSPISYPSTFPFFRDLLLFPLLFPLLFASLLLPIFLSWVFFPSAFFSFSFPHLVFSSPSPFFPLLYSPPVLSSPCYFLPLYFPFPVLPSPCPLLPFFFLSILPFFPFSSPSHSSFPPSPFLPALLSSFFSFPSFSTFLSPFLSS